MSKYCANCGAEMNENDQFCGTCGAPAAGGSGKKGGGTEDNKYKIIGIAVIAVLVLAVGGLVIKGIGGKGKEDGKGSGEIVVAEEKEEETEVLANLRPWMGEWVQNFVVYPNQGSGLLHNYSNEGYYHGHILNIQNSKGRVHVNEEYIDFSDVTKDQKDRFPVSSLDYYETEYGGIAFEDPDSEIRIVFYEHFRTSEGGQDYGQVMKIQANVGDVEPQITYIGNTPFAQSHSGGPDGWAADSYSFVRIDE